MNILIIARKLRFIQSCNSYCKLSLFFLQFDRGEKNFFFFLSLLANTGGKRKSSSSFISIIKIQIIFTHGITTSTALVAQCLIEF